VDPADGRSAATELFAAPTLLVRDPRAGRLISLGEATFIPEQRFSIEQQACCELLAAEQALLRSAWLEVLLFEPVRARIAYLLLLLASAHRARTASAVKLSHARIAELCGITERSVERSMREWIPLERSMGEIEQRIDFDASKTRRLLLCFG
jgi:hypothetical protein